MILTQHFVFIHLPKTGGSFVRRICHEYAPLEWQVQIIDEHLTRYDIPTAYQSLPILGFIRNPYSWYISAYYYLKKKGDNEIFNQISNQGTKDFKSTVLTLMDLEVENVEFGGYSWHIKKIFGQNLDALKIGKFEELRHELLRLMSSAVTLPPSLVKAIQTYPSVNVSSHEHYRTYYDQELREIIAEKDKWIFERFDYAY
ncbi:MAG: hypothetical protein KAI83_08850 [Thiomargarita sp.]|nr:hypothetical protein [Thiomargarita sp.]